MTERLIHTNRIKLYSSSFSLLFANPIVGWPPNGACANERSVGFPLGVEYMSFINFETFEDMFEAGASITSKSGTGWTFSFDTGDYAGYRLTVIGSGLAGSGLVPTAGTILGFTITDAHGGMQSISGLSLSAAHFADELELGAPYEEDQDDQGQDGDDQGEDEDEDGGHVDGLSDDDLYGSTGDDDIDGGDGNDVLLGNAGDDDLGGDAGDDNLDGGDGQDDLDGGDGNDDLSGDEGDDDLAGGLGDDTMLGGSGSDTADYSRAAGTVSVNLAKGVAIGEGKDTLVSIEDVQGSDSDDKLVGSAAANDLDGGAGDDLIKAGSAADDVDGDDGDDNLDGGAGNDVLAGEDGCDVLIGGTGRDSLSGGADQDRFDFNNVSQSGPSTTSRDIILDFMRGSDRIDLAGIDADTDGNAGNQAFHFLGTAEFGGVDGELRFSLSDKAGTAEDRTLISADVNGDHRADFQVELVGLHNLTASDFIL